MLDKVDLKGNRDVEGPIQCACLVSRTEHGLIALVAVPGHLETGTFQVVPCRPHRATDLGVTQARAALPEQSLGKSVGNFAVLVVRKLM
jgi:hypothetical protein